jgi:rubrerythrin
MATERIRLEGPVDNTVHNLVQTLSVKLDSSARYSLYQEDARRDGRDDCATMFARLAERDRESIQDLFRCLQMNVSTELIRSLDSPTPGEARGGAASPEEGYR